jgi:short-subunit dehydrogenase
VPTDCTQESQCRHLVELTIQQYGRLDMLFYNAGRGWPGLFVELTDLTTVETEIKLNYLGLVYCVFYALPHLRQTRGRIVAVGSYGGLVGIPGTAGYNASKHALRGFLNTLRAELRGSGVTVSVAYAGAVETERLKETMGTNVSKVRTMTPERCARVVLDTAARRKRQTIMTAEGKVVVFLYALFPAIVDRLLSGVSALYTRD